MLEKLPKLYLRIVDANFNRAKEGLRVCEDICRFLLEKKAFTSQFKDVRHRLTKTMSPLGLRDFINGREIEKDIGRRTTRLEAHRKHFTDIFYANCQRVKESLRVLEEFAKLKNVQSAQAIKKMRYQIYGLEKSVLKLRVFHGQ